MPLTWLHISDFHLRAGDSYDRDVVLRALVESVGRFRAEGRAPDLIFATGDVGFSGKPGEYEIASAFFDDLLAAAGLERRHLFVIPGNHDVDRDRGVGLARSLTSREESDQYFAPGVEMPHLTRKQAAFYGWYKAFFAGVRECPESSCGPVELVSAGGRKVGILPINSALFCQGDDDHAKLWVGRRALDGAISELDALDADLRIALVHHPLEWLADSERSNVRARLAGNVDLVLRGHLHETDVEQVVSHHGNTVSVAAGASYQTGQWPKRALYANSESTSLEVFPIRYEDSPSEVWTLDPSVFPKAPGYIGQFKLPQGSAPPDGNGAARLPVSPQPVGRFLSNVPSRRGLPVIGRDVELQAMGTRLSDLAGEHVLVLTGAPGVGKSELAREFARRHRNSYPGGTFLVDATSTNLVVDLARVGINFLGMEFPDDLGLEDQCQQALAGMGAAPTLLIYDNVQSFDAVERWLPPAGMPCHVVITTVHDPRGGGWPLLRVEPLSPEKSVELVSALAGARVAASYGAELAAHSGGLPVQLCPAAAVISYEEERGREGHERLAAIAKETRESFSLVYEHLKPPVRLLLHAAAALNAQRIDRGELVAHLTAGADWTDADAADALDACFDVHLLDGDAKLRMHQLFVTFLESVDRSDDLVAALAGIRQVQLGRLVAVASALTLRPADAELAVALTGFRLAPQDWEDVDPPPTADDREEVAVALLELGEFAQARAWFELAVEDARKGGVNGRVDHRKLGDALHYVGSCFSSEGEFELARERFEEAVAEKRKGADDGRVDHQSLGASLHQLGYCLSSVGEFEQARACLEQAVDEKRKSAEDGDVDHQSLGLSLHQVGFCHAREGQFAMARPWFEQSVAEHRKGDVDGGLDHEMLARSLHQIGFCYSSEGDFEQARPWYEQAVEESAKGDIHGRIDHQSVGRSLHQVGACHARQGEFEPARPWFEQAADEARKGDVYGRIDHDTLARSLHQVGFCYLNEGEFEQARPWFEQAVDEAREGDFHGRIDNPSLARSLHEVGTCYARAGQFENARPWYEDAVETARKGNVHGRIDYETLNGVLLSAATCARALGDEPLATRWEAEARGRAQN